MRIVMTNNFFLPRPSGSAHHTAGLARQLAALGHRDRIARKILWLGDMVLVRPFLAIGRPTIVVIDTWIDSYVRRRYRVGDDRIATVMIGVEPDRFVGVDGRKVRERLDLGDRP